jgi:hypothetical protein
MDAHGCFLKNNDVLDPVLTGIADSCTGAADLKQARPVSDLKC